LGKSDRRGPAWTEPNRTEKEKVIFIHADMIRTKQAPPETAGFLLFRKGIQRNAARLDHRNAPKKTERAEKDGTPKTACFCLFTAFCYF
jgi:hypothetical protein